MTPSTHVPEKISAAEVRVRVRVRIVWGWVRVKVFGQGHADEIMGETRRAFGGLWIEA